MSLNQQTSLQTKVKKAIIPAAGLGTRFLPATKTIPKEMLPVVDAPVIFYVVEEAVASGIEDVILIQGRGKTAIEDFFDASYELEDKLLKSGQIAVFERIQKIKSSVNLISIRQKQPLGLGHAIHCAKSIVGSDPVAVLLGDEIMIANELNKNETSITATQELVKCFAETGESCIGVIRVPDEHVSRYGIVEMKNETEKYWPIQRLMEKPLPQETKSRWAIPGRYILSSEIFSYLEKTSPGKNGEIQLTDGMSAYLKNYPMRAVEIKGRRYDVGDKFGFLKANIELALEREDLKEAMVSYLKELVRTM